MAGGGACPPTGVVRCLFCPQTSRTGAGLHCHMRKWHSAELLAWERERRHSRKGGKRSKLLSCRSCDMVFKSTATLHLHRKETHSREPAPPRERAPPAPKRRRRKETYPCLVCGHVFLHHLSLRAHAKQHVVATATTPKHGLPAPAAAAARHTETLTKHPHNSLLLTKGKPGRKRDTASDEETAPRRPGKGRQASEEEEEEADSDFPCPSCARVFSLQSELRTHAELHQSSAHWRQCSVCLQEMDTSKGLGAKKKRRLYHCVPCQHTFPELDAFLEHCQDHLRVRVEEDRIAEAFGFHSNKN